MTIPVILQALAALAPVANKIVEGIRAGGAKNEERVNKLESELLRSGELLVGLTRQLQAVAEELKLQAELSDARERKAKHTLMLAIVALGVGLGALGVALFK